jgi:4-amino-4-deoxy-L-arabinose transferase-like glycosyltransferase
MHLIKKFLAVLKEDVWAYALLIFGFLLRLFYIFVFTKPESYLWSDAGEYDNRALQMAKGIHFPFSTYWPPFFHMFLSLIYRPLIWLGLENQRIKIDIIIFALLYIVGFWCIYQITKKLFSKKIALIVLTILILWYPFIFLNYLVMSENLFFPLFFLGLYFLVKNSTSPYTGFWLGLFWGIATITRPILLLFLPIFIIWALYYKINRRLILNFVLATAVIIALMSIFNFYYTKGAEKFISSSGGFNFAMSWCDTKSVEFHKDGWSFGFGSAANIDYPADKKIVTDVPFENQGYYYKMGLICINEHPFRIIQNLSSIRKLFYSHLFPTTSDIKNWETFRLLFKILTGIAFVCGLLTIVGLLTGKIKFDKTNKKYLYLFALIIASLFITIYLQNVGEERYIIPYSPLLIILSIPFFSFLLDRWRALKKMKSEKWIWLGYLVFIIFSLFVLWFFSVSVKEAYLIKPDGSESIITLPFYHNQYEEPQNLAYKIIVNSNINQKAQINIAFDDIIDEISVNDRPIDLAGTVLNDWERGYIFDVPLNAGENDIYIYGRNTGWGYSLKFNQKPLFIIWMILFLSIGLPLSHLFVIFLRLFYEKKDR